MVVTQGSGCCCFLIAFVVGGGYIVADVTAAVAVTTAYDNEEQLARQCLAMSVICCGCSATTRVNCTQALSGPEATNANTAQKAQSHRQTPRRPDSRACSNTNRQYRLTNWHAGKRNERTYLLTFIRAFGCVYTNKQAHTSVNRYVQHYTL